METLYLQILNMSITGSCVIMAVLLGRLLLQRAPKKYSYTLWAAAGFRLVCPVSFQSVVSLFSFSRFENRTNGATLTHIPADIGLMAAPQGSTGAPVLDNVVNNQLPAATPEASVNPMQVLIFVGMVVWLTGVTVMAVTSIVNYVRLKKSLRFAVRLEGNVWQCETVRSPFLIGLVKPKIYLPYGLDSQTENYILAHEKYHLKRFDHVVKLLAYAVLTLHWFNPLCHIAFRLMNRDMEMSCDEHVLAEKGIATTAYSESLLTIATNRRYPAATPLAFAETGVKERMMNVLKWRKPKAWVSVVAVLVCGVTLISCAANPKLSEPKVDDPSLLEFPGIKWGATMEEVKKALNITEEQISSEYTETPNPSEDAGYLTVTDITLFGEEVTGAGFQFRADPGQEVRLYRITLYLADDADMDKMRETLTEVYGKDVGEYFINYSPRANTEEYKDGTLVRSDWELGEYKKSGDARLWFLANNLGNGSSAGPLNEAVLKVIKDPEFKTYNWVSSVKGTEIYPADGVDLIKNRHKDVSGIPEELTQEWIEKEPLVYISLANRSLGAALVEVNGTAEGEAALVTHNQVIFDANMLIYFEDLIEEYRQEVSPTE